MVTLAMLFLIIAIVCWLIAALPLAVPHIQVGWLGMFFYGLSLVIR